MKKLVIIIILLIALYHGLLDLSKACQKWEPHNPAVKITLYGSPGCSLCKELSKVLDDEQIEYQFYNVREDKSINRRMWQLARTLDPSLTRLTMPLVTVGDRVFISPQFSEFSELYGKKEWALPKFLEDL